MSQLHQIIPITQGNIGNHITPMAALKGYMPFSALGVISPTGLKGVLASTASLLELITSLLKV